MVFATAPGSITAHVAFLLNYLNALFLLDFVQGPQSKLIGKLLTEKNPEDFRITTSFLSGQDHQRSGMQQPQQAGDIVFNFEPVLTFLGDFKLCLHV